MIKFLATLFIKDNKNYREREVRRRYGILCSLTGILLNIFLFAGKYMAGLISSSVAIMADAFNNLSDAGSSIMTLVGFKFSGKQADTEHPFGHGRIEYISGLGVSAVIILMGFELAKTSVEKIIHPQDVENRMLSIIILIISVLVKLYMAYYNTSISKKIDSAAMKATATDSLSDVLATTLVLVAMLVMRFTGINIDGWCGILVAIFILFAGYNAAKDTLSPLLGQPPKEEFVKSIEDIVLSFEHISGIHDLIVHDYGPGRVIISLHAEVPGDINIYELHDIIDQAEVRLNEELGCEAVIHMDPIEVNNYRIQEMKKQIEEIVEQIDTKISIHDFRMVEGPTHTNLIFDVVVPFGYKQSDADIIKIIDEKVKQKWDNYNVVIKVDKAYA